MSKQDVKRPRTVEELLKKYNFSEILGLRKNVEIQKKNLYKIENELNNMLNSFIINLKDVIDSQSEVSLWFYDYVPSLDNKPYTDWTNTQEHDGDIFYNQSTGRVYQFQYSTDSWNENTDDNLIQAMATTNVGIDTSDDHERKIYFNRPNPPYECGDWWIKEDGTLFVCQLTKSTGEYEDSDFINSANYVATIAVKNNNEITVLKGTVTKISDSYVSVTDLATGGSTVINGDNIKSGTIDAKLVTIANNNVILDSDGIKLKNGAKVIGNNGLKNTYLFQNYGNVGYQWQYESSPEKGIKEGLLLECIIPAGLTITSAKIKIMHSPVYWSITNLNSGAISYVWGYSRNIEAYKCTNINNRLIASDYGGSVWRNDDESTYSKIENAFGTNGFSASAPSDSSHNITIAESIDIKNQLTTGLNRLKLETKNTIPITVNNCAAGTGAIQAILEIEGYMTYE